MQTVYNISGAVFIFGLGLILLAMIVFGSIPEAPDWTRVPLWVTLIIWIAGTLVLCVVMIVEVILRMRGKAATFGIATRGGRYVVDVRDQRSPHARLQQPQRGQQHKRRR
ncbi:hypothetical protein ACDF64_08250 [Agromyces sp. MMS24-JH15]|uniref:hypothetical protein n=1 Tax=Agromyces sp. MMS24-JH15 TaxID=3243765 RepID=UPI003748B6BC